MAHLNDDPHPKFHLFLNLPTELQIDIWKYTLTVPQTIRIKSLPRDIQDYENTRLRCVTEAYQTPPLLHVCRCSRATALQFYRLTFERRLLHPVYLNPGLDEVKLIGWDAVHNFSKPMDYPDPELRDIRSLIISARYHTGDAKLIFELGVKSTTAW